jgi:glycosyltransferase involved in cell wall biosynthesis
VTEYERISDGIEIHRIRLKTKVLPRIVCFQLVKYLELIKMVLKRFKNSNVIVVNCHSLDALPIGILFKLLRNAKVIYDTHELETERHGLTGWRQTVSKLLERVFIKFSDQIVVVSDSIRSWYERQYRLDNVHVVRNFPSARWLNERHSHILKERYHITESQTLFIYQGKFAYGRAIEVLLNAFSRLNDDKHIVFLGYGQLEEKIRGFTEQYSNIHLHPAVPPDEVNSYTKSADVGINLTDYSCLSRYFALSNKLFEYLNSGVPVVVSNFPERARVIDDFSCGWKIDVSTTVDKARVLEFFKGLAKDDITQKKVNARKIGNMFVWEKEERRLLNVYSALGLSVP